MSLVVNKDMMKSHPPYPEKFKAGDIAIPLIEINFVDGTQHKIGDEIRVTEKTKSYYNVWWHLYRKK